MAFFLIVPSVMVVAIFLTHTIAERLHCKVRYSSLVLCAVMSFLINYAAIEMSTYLDKWHYIRLGVLILVASIIVTAVNKFLIKNDIDLQQLDLSNNVTSKPELNENKLTESIEDIKNDGESNTTLTDTSTVETELKAEEVSSETTISKPPVNISKKENKLPDKVITDEKSTDTKIVSATLNKKVTDVKTDESNKSDKPSATKTLVTDKNKTNIKTESKPKQEAKSKPDIKPTTDIKSKVDDKSASNDKPKLDTKPKPIAKSNADDKPQISITKTDNAKSKIEDKPLAGSVDNKPKISVKTTVDNKVDNKIQPEKVVIVDNKPKNNKPIINVEQSIDTLTKTDKSDDIDAHLGSLDDILDYAYSQKAEGNIKQAILAYQRALERYKNDDYAPFIAIDLGNIYKEQAAYSKVIKTYEEALKLPVVLRNSDTYKEFSKNLAYLRVVQTVLIKHRALSTPFSKISAQYMREIDNEFKAAQMKINRSRF
ncbi:MAG: hypothetical protein IJ563_06120 [Selenomonadaceae bacterium]|nr:hypothetical protein [Selenomonadaceae bacterium]MBR1859208.1 hypothetical protein [Selenomonadaceae bacterium]